MNSFLKKFSIVFEKLKSFKNIGHSQNAFKRRRRRGKYDCQVLYKQSIKSKINDNEKDENVFTNGMKRAADGNAFNQMMKIPALGTGVTPSSPNNSSNDQSSQMQQLLIQNILQQQAAQGKWIHFLS